MKNWKEILPVYREMEQRMVSPFSCWLFCRVVPVRHRGTWRRCIYYMYINQCEVLSGLFFILILNVLIQTTLAEWNGKKIFSAILWNAGLWGGRGHWLAPVVQPQAVWRRQRSQGRGKSLRRHVCRATQKPGACGLPAFLLHPDINSQEIVPSALENKSLFSLRLLVACCLGAYFLFFIIGPVSFSTLLG